MKKQGNVTLHDNDALNGYGLEPCTAAALESDEVHVASPALRRDCLVEVDLLLLTAVACSEDFLPVLAVEGQCQAASCALGGTNRQGLQSYADQDIWRVQAPYGSSAS